MSGNVDHGTTFRFGTDAYLHILIQGIQKTDEPVHGEAVEASVQEFGDFGWVTLSKVRRLRLRLGYAS
jgi:hypothetical protein